MVSNFVILKQLEPKKLRVINKTPLKSRISSLGLEKQTSTTRENSKADKEGEFSISIPGSEKLNEKILFIDDQEQEKVAVKQQQISTQTNNGKPQKMNVEEFLS